MLLYDGGTWSRVLRWLALCGLDASNGHDIDAISVDNGILYFSTLGRERQPSVACQRPATTPTSIAGMEPRASPGYSMSSSGTDLPGDANIDGLTVKGDTYYMSFDGTTGRTCQLWWIGQRRGSRVLRRSEPGRCTSRRPTSTRQQRPGSGRGATCPNLRRSAGAGKGTAPPAHTVGFDLRPEDPPRPLPQRRERAGVRASRTGAPSPQPIRA